MRVMGGGGRGGGGYSSRFWVDVCNPGLQMWTLFYKGFATEVIPCSKKIGSFLIPYFTGKITDSILKLLCICTLF